MAQVGLAAKPRRRRLDAPLALDPHLIRTVDHHLIDRRIAQQRLQRPEPERALGDPRHQLSTGVVVQQARLTVDERADALVQVALRCARASSLTQQAVAQRDRQLV